ncbi:MAG: DUF1848 domain-containing protein [Oscillospiraceae bacterium]|nr:DUF1848 domain-containing protein [Oscillospiraceae bacterium]
MIISASRRTDIPCYYSEWLFNRIKEKYVFTKNPLNLSQIKKIDLSPENVDGFVFWTKNPAPMLDSLYKLKDYAYYFQFTLNSYEIDIEPGLPDKREIIDTFRRLADIIGETGAGRVIWRYDPIFLNDKYNVEYHAEHFERTSELLKGYAKKVIISFIDCYKKIAGNADKFNIRELDFSQKNLILKEFSNTAKADGFTVETCAENGDFSEYDIGRSKCVDGGLIEKISGRKLDADSLKKDKNQRQECGCVSSVDIGAYNCCPNGCVYCYANYSAKSVKANFEKHNSGSSFLIY